MVHTRSAAKELHQSLKPYRIARSGKFDDIGHDHVSLASIIRQYGGKPDATVTEATTHLVCTEDDLNNRSKKVETAIKNNIPIMMPSWLTDLGPDTTSWVVNDYEWPSSKDIRATKDAAKESSARSFYDEGQTSKKEAGKPALPSARNIQGQLELNRVVKTPSEDLMRQTPDSNPLPAVRPSLSNVVKSKSFGQLIGVNFTIDFLCLDNIKMFVSVALACSLLAITGAWSYVTRWIVNSISSEQRYL
jgi:hypothetical protein